MDRADGKTVSLVFQSPLFTDIDSIVSNRTSSVDFPATRRNLAAIGNPQMAGSSSDYAYRKHRALYLRDGVQIFSGYGTLLSVSGTSIKFSFTWGNVSVFKNLLEYKIRDLRNQFGEEDIHLPWDDSSVATNAYFPANMETGGYRHPAMRVSVILSEIERLVGVTFENKGRLTDYRIPVTGKVADDYAKRLQGAIIGANLSKRTHQYQYKYSLAVGNGDKDIRGMYAGDGLFDVSEFKTLKIEVSSDFQYSVPSYTGRNAQQISIQATTDDGAFAKQLGAIQLYRSSAGARFVYSVNSGVGTSKELTLNIEDFTHIRIEIFTVGTAQTSSAPTVTSGVVNVIPDYDQEQELIYGGVYPIYQNLPDWTVSQLLKNLMKMEGLFAVCPNEKTIRFLSVDDIYRARDNAEDVTQRLIFKDGAPSERSFTYGQYAKKNYFRYAEDETVKKSGDGAMLIDNDNLDAEKDVLKLDFAASDILYNGKVQIPLYTKDDDGNLDYNDVKPRILKYTGASSNGQELLTFDGLDWDSLIAAKYSRFSRCVRNASVVKSSIRIDTMSLAKLDLTVPVYSFSLGHYYAIMKLSTKDGETADIEMLQMNDIATSRDEGAAPEIAVSSNGTGGYFATLTNKTQSEIDGYVADPDYKVCLIRYGFARRGKFFEYKDKTGKNTTSKTCRTVKNKVAPQFGGWRSVRRQKGGGTPCWRIIGDELLRTGKLGHNSQTLKKYENVSLVFELGELMSLPAIPKRAKTKSGRIGNRASDGLAELSIAMYHNEGDGKWKRVSNICQVRSRDDSKTGYWDFEPRNAKSL